MRTIYSTDVNDARQERIARFAESDEDCAALKLHLAAIIQGNAFKGSNRSGQFLEYVVGKAIAGQFDALKERLIGVELFGRSASYNTGDDAIVRVTANDVRRRLVKHYKVYGIETGFRIELPAGSYIPEITRIRGSLSDLPKSGIEDDSSENLIDDQTASSGNVQFTSIATDVKPITVPLHETDNRINRWRKAGMVYFFLLVALNLGIWGIYWIHSYRVRNPASAVLPWSVFFSSPHSMVLITSDPNIAEIQVLTHHLVTVSDYADHRYIPQPDALTPEEIQFCQRFLIGDKPAEIDAPIIADIAQLAATGSKAVSVRGARSIRPSDLHTSDNFIFLGSPRSDPWTDLFSDQLDFRFVRDNNPNMDSIINVHPHPHELALYVPAAPHAVGQSFAIVALVQNPDQSGQVLILAGTTREGTEAAGKFVVDLPRLSEALENCGIRPSGPLKHFELLLSVSIMAGSPNSSKVEACHILPGAPA
jgi:hypothetical protein